MRRALAIFLGFVFALQFAGVQSAFAAMSSSSFIIPSETFGDTGGTSNSASFQLNDTMGEIGPDYGASSASFLMSSGFQTLDMPPVFTFTISSGGVTLAPPPSPTVISTATTTLTTSTNAPFGYTTTIVDDGKLRSGTDDINDVADGAVGPVGTEEYGIGLTGADRAFTDDRATVLLPRTTPGSPRTIASFNSFGASRVTTVTYKMTMSPSTANGTYSHVVTYISSPMY